MSVPILSFVNRQNKQINRLKIKIEDEITAAVTPLVISTRLVTDLINLVFYFYQVKFMWCFVFLKDDHIKRNQSKLRL